MTVSGDMMLENLKINVAKLTAFLCLGEIMSKVATGYRIGCALS